MKSQIVYDWPTRIIHWIFVIFFLSAFIIAKNVDSETLTFTYHMLIGLALSFALILRVLWLFIGTKYARITSFALNPKDLLIYFKGILTGDRTRWAGHNPASSWAGLFMILLALSLGLTGYLMTSSESGKETFEDIHELLANGLLVTAILHVLGVIVHTIRHKELIGLSMLHGRKADINLNAAISQTYPTIGILVLGLVVVFGLQLYQNYSPQTGKLNLLGITLELAEGE